jgi:hypothetical protein
MPRTSKAAGSVALVRARTAASARPSYQNSPPAGRARVVRLAGGLDGFGGGLYELRHLVGVGDHRYVTGLTLPSRLISRTSSKEEADCL